ncbi:MAG TPA: DoxX family protein [Anaerolineae bacterium]|nr:DoxX family protein [Anaerolineae bacterium]
MFKSLFRNVEVQDPPIAKLLFNNTVFGIVWLALRVWLGYQWIDASMHKITNPAWVVTGEALKGFWVNSLKVDPKPVIYFDWYRSFIQFLVDAQAYTWFAKLVAYGELLIGIALILGAFTGIAAFFGAFMNWNFMMAGTASSNPLLFVAAIAIVLGWKVAGYYGLDRWLLPLLGTPWQFGAITRLHKPKEIPVPMPVR